MTFARNTIAIAASPCLATVVHTTASQAEEPSGHVAVPYQNAEFTPLMGGPAEVAVLSGNPQTGLSSILLRFPPMYPGAMHSHSAGYHAIVIEGASKHWTEITMKSLHRYRHPEITGSKPAGKCIKIDFQVMKSQLSSYASKDLWISF
jgi:hypothetical protein